MRNSTDDEGGGQEQRICRKANKNGASRCAKMRMDFGGCFVYKDCAAHSGKLSEGEQYGQENPEEVEEDPPDQTSARRQALRTSFMVRSARSECVSQGLLFHKQRRSRNGCGVFFRPLRFGLCESLRLQPCPSEIGVEKSNFPAHVLKFSTDDD
jgi:hypothetical protein